MHDAPGADVALRAAWQADRIARDIARLERQVSSRNESLARQFDRVLGVLRTWGYVEEWTLTDAGRLLTRLNSEGELVVAEAVREGRLDGIDPATMAAVVSCFTFQRRGPDSNEPHAAAALAEPGGGAAQPRPRRRVARPASRRTGGPSARDPATRSRASPPRSTRG